MNLGFSSDEEPHPSSTVDLSALDKLDEITQRLTMDALRDSDASSPHKAGPSGLQCKKLHTNGETIQISDEELLYRKKLYPDVEKIVKEKVRCTACGTSLVKQLIKGIDLFFHPILKVLVCQDCRVFYGDGNFALDDDNSDTYCRWCAQGGSLYCCSGCNYVFCKPCIRRNFKQSMLEEIEEVDWKCFACNPDALWKHRAICWAARAYVKKYPKQGSESDSGESSNQELRRRKRLALRQKKWGKPSQSSEKIKIRASKRGKSKSNVLVSDEEEEEEKKPQRGKRKSKPVKKQETEEESSDDNQRKNRKRSKERKREKVKMKKEAENEKPHRNRRSKHVVEDDSEEEEEEEEEDVKPKHKKSHEKNHREEKKDREKQSLSSPRKRPSKENSIRAEEDIPKEKEIGDSTLKEPDDEDAAQILVMQNTCQEMEKLTKEVLAMTNSASKKFGQLHGWVSNKNKVSKGQLPTTPAKLSKMIECFRKILDNLCRKTEVFQKRLTEGEAEWSKIVGGEKEADNGDSVAKTGEEPKVVEGEATLTNGKHNGVATSDEETRKDDLNDSKETNDDEKTKGFETSEAIELSGMCENNSESESGPLESTSCVLDSLNINGSVRSVSGEDESGGEKEKEVERVEKMDQDEENNMNDVSANDSKAADGEDLPTVGMDEDKEGKNKSEDEIKLKSCASSSGDKEINADSDSEPCKDTEINEVPENEDKELPVKGDKCVDKIKTLDKQPRRESIQDLFDEASEEMNVCKDTLNTDSHVNEGNHRSGGEENSDKSEREGIEEVEHKISDTDDQEMAEIVNNEEDDLLKSPSKNKKVDVESEVAEPEVSIAEGHLADEQIDNEKNAQSKSPSKVKKVGPEKSDPGTETADLEVASDEGLQSDVVIESEENKKSESPSKVKKVKSEKSDPDAETADLEVTSDEDLNSDVVIESEKNKKSERPSKVKKVKSEKSDPDAETADLEVTSDEDLNSDVVIESEKNKKSERPSKVKKVKPEKSDPDAGTADLEVTSDENLNSDVVIESEKEGPEEKVERIKPTKVDRDAKMAFLLDTSSSSSEEGIKRSLRSKKSNISIVESDSSGSNEDSGSPIKSKVVKKERRESGGVISVESLLSKEADAKLKSGCFIPVKKLDVNNYKMVNLESKKNKRADGKDNLLRAIDRLGNFSKLEKPKSKKGGHGNDTDRKSAKSKGTKETKEESKTDSSDHEVDLDFDDVDGSPEPAAKTDDKMNELAAKLLVESSLSDFSGSESDEDPKKKNKKKVTLKKEEDEEEEEEGKEDKKQNKGDKKKKRVNSGDSSSDFDMTSRKKSWRNDKLLKGKLSETDSSEAERRWRAKKERVKESMSNSEEDSDSKKPKTRKKIRKRLASSDSDMQVNSSDENASSDFEAKKKRKRTAKSESSEGSSSGSRKQKKKRRRIKKVASDSDESEEDDGNKKPKAKVKDKGKKSPKGKGLAEETRAAAKNEGERRKRIAERQKLYNEIFTDSRNLETLDKLVLDFDPDTKEPLVSVHPELVKKLKPHQVNGVKFMWEACCETLKMMKKEPGSGCILAHCMGLGKTLQVIALVHTLLGNPETGISTVLIICPLNTVLNWVNEFRIWLKDLNGGDDIEVYELSRYKANVERMYQLKDWQKNGGVMVLGYNMYRTLINRNTGKSKKSMEAFRSTLVDPGPDLVVCDEGHLLKNEASAVSKAVKSVKTSRRIILTGTPLQNNLKEYHCMVQFVKPNLLGTSKEFQNRFVNPISNGQLAESTPHDVRVMKRRAHVLHKMLEGCVQRCDYSVLTPFLPPKHEYVMCIQLTEIQSNLYLHYLENLSQKAGGASLFNDFQNLQRIWTHPRLLKISSDIQEKKKLMASDSEGSLKDFIDDDESTSSSSESSEAEVKKRKKLKRNCKDGDSSESSDVVCLSDENTNKDDKDKSDEDITGQNEWWRTYVMPEDLEKVEHSGKLVLLLDIIQKCELIGDKVLVFSQSLYSLDVIEHFLYKIDEMTQEASFQVSLDESLGTEKGPSFIGSWAKGIDFFRIDGSVSGENRNMWCKNFNREDNLRARLFLISTRAGGMGINLIGANRVILFDASWNPSNDLQSIFRIYRFGQKKPCYVYRFLAQGTMEEKIYNRQVTKLSLALRVVDEQQIQRHFNLDDLQELYRYEPQGKTKNSTPMLPKDRLLAELIQKYPDLIDNYHEHDSLLENKTEEELTEEERKAAWEDFENEKKEKLPETPFFMGGGDMAGGMAQNMMAANNFYANTLMRLRESIILKHPNATEEQISNELNKSAQHISQYFNSQAHPQLQQFYNPLSPHAQNMGIYPGMRQVSPHQVGMFQSAYGMPNYYHTPLLPSSSTSSSSANNNRMVAPVSRDPYYNNPGGSNMVVMQRRIQPIATNTVNPVKNKPVDESNPVPKLKIRSDLMPVDDDIIIE